MSIFGSQETFPNVHVNNPAAELDIDVFLGGVSVSPCRVEGVYYVF